MDREIMETTSMSNDGRLVSQLNLPSGFRFKPTDPELIWDYLKKQVNSESIDFRGIAEVDLSKYNPWKLPELAFYGEDEWYFFTQPEKKYPRGTRPNRAAGDGFWKATGTDKKIYMPNHIGHNMLVGFRKSLVFYEGKPPRGDKTNWIMHEYRLANNRVAPAAHIHHRGSKLPDDWVLCRIYDKKYSSRAVGREHDLESMLSEFDEQIQTDSPPQGQEVASSSQHARLTHEFAVQTDLQTGPALNHLQQFHQGPGSSSSFTGPEYYNACIGADAGQRSSFSDDLEEVQTGFGEGALFSGFDHPPAGDQSFTYPRPNEMGNFGYGQPLGRNS